MNIYFSCSPTGGRDDQPVYAAIVDYLLAAGHQVPTAHLARQDVMVQERVVDPVEVYARDVAWVRACDALIAEVTTPSHGVGYETALALSLRKPVLCCYQEGAAVSKMITGNIEPSITVMAYTDAPAAVAAIAKWLTGVTPQHPAG